MIWIGAPTMRDDGPRRGRRRAQPRDARGSGTRSVAPDVIYVDAYELFGDENGELHGPIVDDRDDGEDESRVRVGDGVHFTPAGAEYLAEPCSRCSTRRYDLGAQADPSRPDRLHDRRRAASRRASTGTSTRRRLVEQPRRRRRRRQPASGDSGDQAGRPTTSDRAADRRRTADDRRAARRTDHAATRPRRRRNRRRRRPRPPPSPPRTTLDAASVEHEACA